MDQKTKKESYKVHGRDLVNKIKELVKEGNIRRIIIKDEKGDVIVEFPLTVAVVGTVLAPVLAAVGAMAALLTNCTIEVERR